MGNPNKQTAENITYHITMMYNISHETPNQHSTIYKKPNEKNLKKRLNTGKYGSLIL